MSKRNLGRRIREEEEATAHAFQEFIQTFQINTTQSKTFVKSGTLHPVKGQEQCEKGQIYNPKPIIKQDPKTVKTAIECARLLKDNKTERNKGQEKQKSNLELLKEELKLRHSLSEEKYKSNKTEENWDQMINESEQVDISTTNLFVANLSQKMTENDLMHLFGTYGPLASIKIMWPRGDVDIHRSTNCGFVAFMSRKDAERALNVLKHRDDMNVGWAKCVEVPSNPIYIPPELLKFHMPPPHTGLPFNAQPSDTFKLEKTNNESELNDLLYSSVVKVIIPLNKKMLMLVHRMVEFVVREGPLFEAMIMNREIKNPMYQFLFDNKSPLHIYYRWKLYSVMQGENKKKWSTEKFRMFEGGSIWIPPVICDYTEGMPESLIKSAPLIEKTQLSESQLNRLVNYIQNLTTHRKSVSEVMIFCLHHQDALNDIIDVLVDSFRNPNTKAIKKIGRLYLLTDVLYNSNNKKLRHLQIFQENNNNISEVFENLNKTYNSIENIYDKEEFKWRVQKVLKAWELWSLYSTNFVSKLETSFAPVKETEVDEDSFADEPLDGANLLKRSMKNNIDCEIKTFSSESKKQEVDYSVFVPSRWETIDPGEIEAQAMSTQKMFHMDQQRKSDKTAAKTVSAESREKLRKIEIMVIQYREDIETGKRKLKKGIALEQDINNYRQNLIDKMKYGLTNCSPESTKGVSSEEEKYESRKKVSKSSSKNKRSSAKEVHKQSKRRSRK